MEYDGILRPQNKPSKIVVDIKNILEIQVSICAQYQRKKTKNKTDLFLQHQLFMHISLQSNVESSYFFPEILMYLGDSV